MPKPSSRRFSVATLLVGAIVCVAALSMAGCTPPKAEPPKAETPKTGPLAQSKVQDLKALFKTAVSLTKKGECDKALPIYETVLRAAPGTANALWNAGICAKRIGKYARAAAFFERMKAVQPGYLPLWSNLVQVHQARGATKARDDARKALIAHIESSADPKTKVRWFYVREWYRVDDREVFVFEYLDLRGKFALRYKFLVKTVDKPDFVVSLGSYETINAIERDLGRLKPGQRLFHLDAYRGGTHWTLGFYEGEPSYDAIRPLARRIIESNDPGKFALSSSRFGGSGLKAGPRAK